MNILDRNLDECQTFSEISKWRKEKYKIDEKSGDDYTGILTNIYKEPTHFIYELLQNADDAMATSVKFVLSQDKIEFFHNGTKEFSLNDIISITGVGNSSKDAQNTTAIGKFGVGFKAVFAVTDTPLIYSTTYNFQIENLSVPLQISGRDLEGHTTIFQLDFKREGRATLYRRNETLLRSMSPETILFLKSICRVDIVIDDEQLPSISISRNEADQFFSRIEFHAKEKAIELLKFSKDGCSVVYQLNDGIVTPIVGSKISVFFPTIIDSNLPFMVDAPFQTSTTREAIDFKLPHNKLIVKKFSDLFSDSIDKLKELNLFNFQVFNDIMPIDVVEESEDFPIYTTIQSAFLEDIKNRSFVPTNQNKLLPASQVLLADDSEIIELLDHFPNLNFAHRELSAAALAFIGQTDAKEFEPTHLLHLVNKDKIILKAQTDEWLYRLYEYCLKSMLEDSWSRIFSRTIKQTPIIRTRSDSFTAPFLNDNPNVFRPSKGIPDNRTINPMFLTESAVVSDETKSRMKGLLNELGITERKPVIVLREDYFKDYASKAANEKLEIFKTAADIYRQSEPKDKSDIEAYLKNIAFIPSEAGEFKLPANLYNPYNPDLSYLLHSRHPELFCSKFIGDNAAYREFCLKLGVKNQLRIDAVVRRRSNREDFIELYKLVGSSQDYGSSTREYTRTDYESPTLSMIFSGELSPDTTSRLASLLQNILPEQLKESFEWTHYGNKKEVIGPSSLCKLLTNSSWIAQDDKMVKPVDISYDDFCELYKVPRDNVLQNVTWSNDDIIKQLSNKEQEAIKLMRELDLSPQEMHELRRTTLEMRKKSDNLNKKQSSSIEDSHDYTQADDDSLQDEITTDEYEDDSPLSASQEYEAADTSPERSIATNITASSSWSNVEQEEREVFKGLIDWYKEEGYTAEQKTNNKASYTMKKGSRTIKLVLLPKNSSGYNIEISDNDKIIKTVAVIKTDLGKRRFTISESQWNLSNRDDIQHSIYLVSRRGDDMEQIVIDDLRERIKDGKARTVPGVIYF